MVQNKTDPAGRELSPLGSRVGRVYRELYGSSQAAMAKDLGVSQPLISKVVRGEQEPGPKLLAALVKNPRLNPRWLMEGGGEAFFPVERELGLGLFLPVFKRIQTAFHRGDTDAFAALQFPLSILLKSTVYLLEIQPGDAVLRFPELKFAAGDLLALDSDASTWSERPQILTNRLVAVRINQPESAYLQAVAPTKDRASTEESDYQLGRVITSTYECLLWVEIFSWDSSDDDRPANVVRDLHHGTFPVADILACCALVLRGGTFDASWLP